MLDTTRAIETPEGVTLDLAPAGPVIRAQAWLWDFLLRLMLYMVFGIGCAFLGRMGVGVFSILAFLTEWFYPVLFEVLGGGRTPGKRVAGLQVLMDDGAPVSWSASLARNFLLTADFLPLLYGFGLLSMLLNRDFKRLGDLAAGTVVVHAEPPPPARRLSRGEVALPRARLTLDEQRAVVSFAERLPTFSPQRAEELAGLAEPVTEAAGPEGVARLLTFARGFLGRREDRPQAQPGEAIQEGQGLP
ncbi:MAG: RDD family protein [Holophagaceae bacterium]|nr:RDD family protein [Holophagaceae bacterium]